MTFSAKLLPIAFVVYASLSLGSMATMSVGAAVLGIAILLARAWPRLSGLEGRYLRVSLALAAALLVSLLAGLAWPLSYGGRPVAVSLAKDMAKAWYLFWPLLLVGGLRALGEKSRARVLKAWLIAFGALSAIAVFQHFTGFPRPQPIPTYPGRFHATAFLGHHLSLASIFLFPFFIALEALRSTQRFLPRPLLGAIVVAGGAAIFLSYSRMAWVALPAGVLLWVSLALPRKTALAAAMALVLTGAALTQLPAVRIRLENGMGVAPRQELWRANLEFFKARPITGTGWHHNLETAAHYFRALHPDQTDFFVGHAHNNLIEMLASTGLLGTAAWLAWLALALWLALRSDAETQRLYGARFGTALACAWFAFHVNGLTQVNFWESKVLHQIMWTVAWTLLWAGREPA